MERFKDAHYFQLPSQGNIYTFSHLKLTNGLNKILVATLKREIFSFEYHETQMGALKPILKEISFTYIPSGAEIIALDVFNKSDTKNDFVIGIAIIKNNGESNGMESFLNIYTEYEESTETNLESMAQNCFNIELNFVPYHLTHTKLVIWDNDEIKSKETIFILSGGDCHAHLFKENKTIHGYKETDLKEYFPEFNKPPSIITWISVYYYDDYKSRLTAFGCECGFLKVVKFCVKSKEIFFNITTRFINSITSVRIYPESANIKTPDFMKSDFVPSTQTEPVNFESDPLDPILNLVCVNSILPSVLFRDVLNYGLQKYDTLRRVDNTCISSCCEVADIDFSGFKEILIGSSSEEIFIYKFNPLTGFHFEEERKVVSPVLGIKYLDITGDSLKELIVFTLKGVYIFQYDHKYIEDVLKEKINALTIPRVGI